jgi:LPXTG-site transpeptidase (sortase) family protein
MYYVVIKSMNFSQIINAMYEEIKANKWPFLAVFFVIVLFTYGFLFVIDFIPEPVTTEASEEKVEEKLSTEEELPEVPAIPEVEEVTETLPIKLIIDKLDREVVVLNPESREIADLDAALLSGVVRHPDSADFSEPGNIFILGHSSYLPTVFNKNFQALNGIQDLTWGDTIRLQSADTEYIYRVQKVYKAKTSDIVVPFTPGKAHLTLATCNSFGSKDDRFIVEAQLLESKPL